MGKTAIKIIQQRIKKAALYFYVFVFFLILILTLGINQCL
jgi:hypothetical protein